jgi:hypothetical protein
MGMVVMAEVGTLGLSIETKREPGCIQALSSVLWERTAMGSVAPIRCFKVPSAPLTSTIDSRGSEHVIAEVESQVEVWIHLVVKKMVAGVGCACKKTCQIFLLPVVGELTLGGLTWARVHRALHQVTVVHELPQQFMLTNVNS